MDETIVLINRILKENNMKYVDLAKEFGVTRQMIDNVIHKKDNYPNFEVKLVEWCQKKLGLMKVMMNYDNRI